jgi:surface polysaccharide O-acyltransferase-like enzyme
MFLGYIHSFRAIAIFFIVSGHCIDGFDWQQNKDMERILKIIFGNGTVLFVFIAGYLFQYLSVKYNFYKYFYSKFKYVISPYLIISIPAIIAFTFFVERETVWEGFYNNPVWVQVVLFYLTGLHLAPLWFIPMIVMFYISSPFLIKADNSKYFYILLPLFFLISYFIDRGFPYQSFIHFFSIYVFGMFFSRYRSHLDSIISNGIVILFLLIIIVFLCFSEYLIDKGTMTYLNFVQKTCLSVFLLGLLIKLNGMHQSKFIALIADSSFGIYFIHSYVITGAKLIVLNFNGRLFEGGYLFTLTPFIVMSICVCFVLIVNKIFKSKSRFFIGS